MLAMICNNYYTRMVPTGRLLSHHYEHGGRCADASHGRVLLSTGNWEFVVWDPITDEEWKVPFPLRDTSRTSWAAAVLCSAAAGSGGCDHLDCHRGPFTVVFVASIPTGPILLGSGLNYIYTYSSTAAAWSEPICAQQHHYEVYWDVRGALVGNTLYFANHGVASIVLKYNMQLRQISWIQLPSPIPFCCLSALTATEHGGLCLAVEDGYEVYIWSTKDADEVDVMWEQNRVIKLNTLLPVGACLDTVDVVGFTDGLGTIFVSVDRDDRLGAAYAIDMKTNKVKKVYKHRADNIFPYMSFYTPALEAHM